MSNKYIKSFLIGTSIVTVTPFYLSVMMNKSKNYTFEQYVFLAPFYFGLMNTISLYFGNKYNLTLRERLFYISLISPFIVLAFVNLTNAYNYPSINDWLVYFSRIFLFHFITYNVVIYTLEKII